MDDSKKRQALTTRLATGLAILCVLILASIVPGLLLGGRPRKPVAPAPLSRELIAVGDAHFPPFTYLEGGEAKGFDVDLVKELARRQGLNVTIRLTDWASAMKAIQTGDADILVGVSDLEERRAYLGFSERMLTMKSCLFTGNETFAWTRLEDLGPTTPLGVEKGDITNQYIQKAYPHIVLREYPDQGAVIQALASKEIEVAALDYYSGLLGLQRLGLRGQIKIIGAPFLEASYCLGVKKGEGSLLIPLNDGIESLKADGYIKSLADHWLGTNILPDRNWIYVLYGLGLLACLAIILLAWNFTLRHAVRQRTAELEESNEIFRLYMEHSPIFMYVKDEKLRPLKLSKNHEVLLGRPMEGILGVGLEDILSPDQAHRMMESDREALREGKVLEGVEEIGGRALSFMKFPIPRKGKPPFLAGFMLDITEKRQADEKILRSLKEKETLIRELHHRTKNTLQVIRGIILLEAAGSPGNEELQSLVKKTEERIQAIALVHQMLHRSQNLSRLSIKDYITELSTLVLRGYEARGHDVALDLEIVDDTFLLDMAIPLGLVLNELLTNSLVHGFPGGRQGRIAIELGREEGRDYLLSYSDDGVGLPEDFDFRGQQSLGLRLIFSIGEDQLLGKVEMEGSGGVRCSLRFRDGLYAERV